MALCGAEEKGAISWLRQQANQWIQDSLWTVEADVVKAHRDIPPTLPPSTALMVTLQLSLPSPYRWCLRWLGC